MLRKEAVDKSIFLQLKTMLKIVFMIFSVDIALQLKSTLWKIFLIEKQNEKQNCIEWLFAYYGAYHLYVTKSAKLLT